MVACTFFSSQFIQFTNLKNYFPFKLVNMVYNLAYSIINIVMWVIIKYLYLENLFFNNFIEVYKKLHIFKYAI